MLKNCMRDVERVVVFVDEVLGGGMEEEKEGLKEKFGLGGLEDEDFVV